MYIRSSKPLKSQSFFLFGSRGVGKSTLINTLLKGEKALKYDLLDLALEARLLLKPEELYFEVMKKLEESKDLKWVFIDEIQKIPELLNTVHKLIEETDLKFALTGSSARKLKRGGANLLAGRAFENKIFPLTMGELEKDFDLDDHLRWGGLPRLTILKENEKIEFLSTYVNRFLKEEIQGEQLIRKMRPFRFFIEIAAQNSAKLINYSKIARDVGVDSNTIKTYFDILEETFVVHKLEAFHTSVRKRQLQSPKYYFFDLGVLRTVQNVHTLQITPKTSAYGFYFEHFIFHELIAKSEYEKNYYKFFYLTTKDGAEIDFVIERPGKPYALVEVKSKDRITEEDTKALSKIAKDFPFDCESYVISKDETEQKIGDVTCLNYKTAIKSI